MRRHVNVMVLGELSRRGCGFADDRKWGEGRICLKQEIAVIVAWVLIVWTRSIVGEEPSMVLN